MKIAITGHRPNKLGNDYDLTSPLMLKIKSRIHKVIDHHIMNLLPSDEDVTLITGMALGIDTLFAKIAIESKLPFIAAIPCIGQEKMWPDKSKDVYRSILANPFCKRHLVSETGYDNSVMQKRNIWMVDNCDLLIAVWDGTSGGTANCVKYAESIGKEITRINPKSDEKSL